MVGTRADAAYANAPNSFPTRARSTQAPSRGVVIKDPKEVLKAYRNIFRTLVYRKTLGLRRFATENFVFDDQIGHVYVVGDPSLMPNMPFPKGTEVYVRLVHCFQLRDGLITREIAYELWRELDSEIAHDDIPEDAASRISRIRDRPTARQRIPGTSRSVVYYGLP